MKKYFKLILLWGIILIFLTGCAIDLVVPENDVNSPATEGSLIDENPIGGLGTGKGTLKIYLTDAPGDYQEVNINISKIEGHIAVDGDEGEDAGWKTLKEWTGDGLPVDLITLENVSLLLSSSELLPNKYTQLRIFLNGEASVVVEGEPNPLEIPSSANSGIKLNHPFEIMEGMITELTIDFDAEKSVIKTGNGKYKMKPVIGLSSETYSAGELPEGVGTVYGNVSYESGISEFTGISGANIELAGGAYIFANTTTTSGEEGSEGNFNIDNVPAGTYTLNVVAGGYYNYSVIDVGVTDGGATEVNVVLSPRGISGIVVGSDTALAIEGATVSVILDSVIISTTTTDSAGFFSIEQLPVDIYDLLVTFDGYDDYNAYGIAVETAGEITNIGTIVLTLSTPSL